ncbi:serine/threonine-protein kinase haspin [Protopterus annectens]|uniref:serine/threonine-protein kinase haspin n=1 Tax=Protopterus annectens TaxID=7888 RepID=UPI001CF9418D|nr:serine/threonine-protein kinase haspin [Protopterus annectens]
MAQKYSCITKDPSISEISCTDLEDSLCRKVESSDINEILHQNQMHLIHEKTPATQPCQVEGCKDLPLHAECKSISLPSKRTSHLKRSISAPLNAETKNECVLGSIASSTRDDEAKQTSLRSVKCISSSCSRNEIVVGTEMSGSRELFSESVMCLGSPASPPGTKCIAAPTTPLTADIESSFHELERKRAELVHLCTSVKAVINLSPLNVHKALYNGPVMQNSSCKGKSGTLLEPVSAKECLDVDRSLHVLNYVTSETERKIAELKQLCSIVQPFVLLEAMALDASTADNNRTESTPFVSDMQHERSRIRTRKIRRDSKKLCTKLFPNYDESSGEIKDCKADICIKPQDEEIHVSNNFVELYCPQPPEPLCPTDVQCGIPEKKTEFKEDNRKSDEHLNHYFGDKLAPHSIQSKVLKPKVTSALKEGAATARKACITGFSSSRWGKRAKTKDFSKKNPLARSKKDPDFSFSDFRHHKENKRQVFEGISRGGVLGIFTPGTMQKAGLHDSFFCSPSPSNCPLEFSQLLSSRGWSRLKASLSVHNKKKVVPTPSRLKRLELRDVHKSGLITPQRGTPGFLHRQDMYAGTPCDDLIGPSPSHELSFMGALTPLGSPSYIEDISDAEKVFQECQQDGPISFEECIPPKKLKQCVKIGEGVFGEVFRSVNDKNESVALKIIPIEGQDIVNGESQKTFDSILPEIIISKELSCLTDEKINRTDGFVTLHSVHCVKGSYPSHLLKAWDKFDKERGSENDRPDFFGEEQLFIVLEFEFGGSDLEHMKNKLSSAATLLSILHQVTASLAVAEEALKFEHRDLHWGNVLVKTTDLKEVKYTLNGTEYTIMTRGVQTNIIDYTLSRLEKDGLTVFCDMSADEDLFKGEGDYQFDIYRKMREENLNSWIEYNPHSNVLWLHYLADKMLNEMVLKRKLRTAPMKAIWKKIKEFHSEVRTFSSAVDVLQCSKLFQ